VGTNLKLDSVLSISLSVPVIYNTEEEGMRWSRKGGSEKGKKTRRGSRKENRRGHAGRMGGRAGLLPTLTVSSEKRTQRKEGGRSKKKNKFYKINPDRGRNDAQNVQKSDVSRTGPIRIKHQKGEVEEKIQGGGRKASGF